MNLKKKYHIYTEPWNERERERERERESIIITTWDSERTIQVCTSTLMQSLRA